MLTILPNSFAKHFVAILRDLDFYNTDCPIVGAKSSSIRALSAACNVTLPKVYRKVQLYIGQGAGELFIGSCFKISELHQDLVKDLNDMLALNGLEVLPEKAFVFMHHQGYIFNWFIADGTPDPVVYEYSEGSKEILCSGYTYTEWMLASLAGHRKVHRQVTYGE